MESACLGLKILEAYKKGGFDDGEDPPKCTKSSQNFWFLYVDSTDIFYYLKPFSSGLKWLKSQVIHNEQKNNFLFYMMF